MLATRTSSPSSACPDRHERKAFFLCRTKAPECLQGCGRLRSCRLAADAGGQPDISIFRNSDWVVRLVIVLLVIGFPVALIIAWAFEATSEGIKRTEAADAAGLRSRGGAWIYVVLIGVALSVVCSLSVGILLDIGRRDPPPKNYGVESRPRG